jgi:hypothetical protein
MNRFSKVLTGAAAAALVTVAAAAPAQAQRYPYPDRDRGIDVGDIITGVVVAGGIAAAVGAVSGGARGYGYDRYGYGDRYGSRYGSRSGYGERAALEACGYEAERYSRGRVQITEVDRRSSRSYRVRGIIDSGYDNRGYGYGYGRDDRYGYGNDRYARQSFTCTARDNGRITGFRVNNGNRW